MIRYYFIKYIINLKSIHLFPTGSLIKKRKLLDNRFIIKEFFNYYNK